MGSRTPGRPARLPLAVLAVLVTALVAACSGDAGTDPADDVRSGYAAYAEAVSAKDGGRASGLVTAATLEHYDGLRELALTAEEKALAKERIIDQLTVLSMRANIPAETLRTADARGVVAAAVASQVISSGGPGASALRDVRVDGDAATATLGAGEGSPSVALRFRRESGAWKVDLTGLLEPAETALKAAVAKERLTTRSLLQQVMTSRVGAAKAERLWEPIGR